ncbi:MAG: leucine-rich repeat domain-containing protein [Mycoplasmataceae bacterium]|nr:leucine-rich repeat domain-containing protein [Mycoplasmataceae bacterium]
MKLLNLKHYDSNNNLVDGTYLLEHENDYILISQNIISLKTEAKTLKKGEQITIFVLTYIDGVVADTTRIDIYGSSTTAAKTNIYYMDQSKEKCLELLPTKSNIDALCKPLSNEDVYSNYVFDSMTINRSQFSGIEFGDTWLNITELPENFMEYFYYGRTDLTKLTHFDFSGLDNVTKMGNNAFCATLCNCTNLKSLPTNFSLPRGLLEVGREGFAGMFWNCSSLETLPFEFNFPDKMITAGTFFAEDMFGLCSKLSIGGQLEPDELHFPVLASSGYGLDCFYGTSSSLRSYPNKSSIDALPGDVWYISRN